MFHFISAWIGVDLCLMARLGLKLSSGTDAAHSKSAEASAQGS